MSCEYANSHEHLSDQRSLLKTPVSNSSYSMSPRCAAIGLDQVIIRKRLLEDIVEVLHVRVVGGAVEIEVIFLDILTVLPWLLVRPNRRSFSMGSGVQSASAKQRCCRSSLMPASPSFPNGRRASGPGRG